MSSRRLTSCLTRWTLTRWTRMKILMMGNGIQRAVICRPLIAPASMWSVDAWGNKGSVSTLREKSTSRIDGKATGALSSFPRETPKCACIDLAPGKHCAGGITYQGPGVEPQRDLPGMPARPWAGSRVSWGELRRLPSCPKNPCLLTDRRTIEFPLRWKLCAVCGIV